MTYPNGSGPGDERASLGQLVSSLAANVSTLVRDEIALAKAELAESAKRGATGGGLIAVTIGLIALAVLLLTFGAVYGLSAGTGLPLWSSFLIIAGVYLVAAAIVAFLAKRQLEQARGPQQAAKAHQDTTQILGGLVPKQQGDAASGTPATTSPETPTATSPVAPTPPVSPTSMS